jgi:hypothetical protein
MVAALNVKLMALFLTKDLSTHLIFINISLSHHVAIIIFTLPFSSSSIPNHLVLLNPIGRVINSR